MRMQSGLWLVVIALLAACAGAPPFDTKNINTALTPNKVETQIDAVRGARVMWGGVILNSKNLETGTQLEILAYPLNDRQRPRLDREPLGRFIVEHRSYLETVDYAPGRELSVTGTISGTKEGKIDESKYIYPAVTSEQLHLWPKGGADEPQIHFGIGVMFHN